MSYKPRILWVGEATYLNTGYAVYGRELLNRLYKTNNFVLAELAGYGSVDDHRRHDLPWIYYANVPYKDDKQALEEYYSNPINEFGDWMFNDVCLDFEPDIVISITDPWMHEYQFSSPYRPLYKMVVMPTIDSAPQQPQWMSMYMEADRIATYSSYGKRILEEHGNGNIEVFDILRPGYDINAFYPIPNKQELRKQLRAPTNNNDVIFGTVMRNQKRKLFDDLFIAFRLFLDQHPEYAANTLLYCHTSFPDQGWDIPRLLKEHKLANKVLFTYVCRKCHNILPSFFNDVVRICPFCGDRMHMSNTHMGATNEQLGKIYNLFDFYVQYSTCEGLGIPAVEAAACSTPVLEVDYSAMEDVVRCLNGVPIPVKRLYREVETHMYRAYPDNNFLAEQFYKCRNMGGVELTKWKHKTLEGATKYFNWDDVSAKWINMIDSLKINQSVWKTTKPFIYQPNININQDLPNHIFIEQAIYNISGKNDLFYRYIGSRILRDLNYGARIKGFGGINYSTESFFAQRMKFQPYTKKDVIDDLKIINDKNNKYEYMRMMKYQGKYNPVFNVKNAKR